MIIGITGGVGSGKSTVTDILFEKYGFRVLRTDDIAKALEKPGACCYEALVKTFGESILSGPAEEESPIDNAKFAALIFNDPEARKTAEAIIHPATWEYVENAVAEDGDFAVETALPGERFRGFCDEVWFVYVEPEKRIARLEETRGYTREKCESIIRQQISDEEYIALADYILDNSGSLREMEERVAELLKAEAAQ